jgi:hypothetical protein
MNEILPVMAGVVIGLIIPHLKSKSLAAVTLIVLSILCGAVASWITGELRVSWGYLLIDSIQVAAAAFLMSVLVVRWRRRRIVQPRTRLNA